MIDKPTRDEKYHAKMRIAGVKPKKPKNISWIDTGYEASFRCHNNCNRFFEFYHDWYALTFITGICEPVYWKTRAFEKDDIHIQIVITDYGVELGVRYGIEYMLDTLVSSIPVFEIDNDFIHNRKQASLEEFVYD